MGTRKGYHVTHCTGKQTQDSLSITLPHLAKSTIEQLNSAVWLLSNRLVASRDFRKTDRSTFAAITGPKKVDALARTFYAYLEHN